MILSTFPRSFVAGDTLRVLREYGSYPVSVWSATLYAENGVANWQSAASTSGTAFAFTITAAVSAALTVGDYFYRVRVTSAGIVETAEEGWLEVLTDPAAAGNKDPRSWARRTLEAVEAFLEGNASTAQQSLSIAGRALSRWPLSELLAFRDKLRSEVAAEDARTSTGGNRKIKLRYANP